MGATVDEVWYTEVEPEEMATYMRHTCQVCGAMVNSRERHDEWHYLVGK